MVLVRKLPGSDWRPKENMGILPGEEMDISNPWRLIEEGKVELVNKPIMVTDAARKRVEGLVTQSEDLEKQIALNEPNIKEESISYPDDGFDIVDVIAQREAREQGTGKYMGKATFKEMTPEEKRLWRINNLREAREKKVADDELKRKLE